MSSIDRTISSMDDWDELAARIAATPENAKIRGMFLSEVVRLGGPRLAGSRRYVPFSMYPVREYMDLILRVARAKYPSKPAARAVMELGLTVYSVFASSIAGTAIFAVANVEFQRVCELSPKAYGVTLSPGGARAVNVTSRSATMQLRDVWVFPEIFHAGIWVGAMDATKVSGSIDITRHSLCDVDLHLTWNR